MKIRATVTKGDLTAGVEYDLPEKEAMAAIMAGNAEPLVTDTSAFKREKAVMPQHQTRWRTR
jgi:hypothetical protein